MDDFGASSQNDDSSVCSGAEVRASDLARATLKAVRSRGAVVLLDTGEEAWLPAAEYVPGIKQHEDLRLCSARPQEQSFDVVIYDTDVVDPKSRKLVSYVRAHSDPWESAVSWSDGIVRCAQVHIATADHAYGIIPPGVRARIDLKSIRELFQGSWREFAILMPGDEVAGYVRRSSDGDRERLITLDVASFVQSSVQIADALSADACPASATHFTPAPVSGLDTIVLSTGQVKRVFVVDNEKWFCEGLKRTLEREGCQVTTSGSAEEALEAIRDKGRDEPYDLALIDIQLADGSDCDGMALAATIRAEDTRIPIVLVTGQDLELLSAYVEGYGQLLVSDLIDKPIGREQLARALAAAAKPLQPLRDLLSGDSQQAAQHRPRLPSYREDLDTVLEDLRIEFRADTIVLFAIHPDSLRVKIIHRADPSRMVEYVRPNIERSPIQDVALDREDVLTGEASSPAYRGKHRWLLHAYHYQSCIGVAVPAPSEYAYALFAFSRNRHVFKEDQFPSLRRAARQLAAVLFASRLENALAQVKPYEILGRTYGSMAHDLRTLMSANLRSGELCELLADDSCLTGEVLERAREDAKVLHDVLLQAANIVHMFRNAASPAHDEPREMDLAAEIGAQVELLHSEYAELSRYVLTSESAQRPLVLRMKRTALGQILFNLVTNAVQQMDSFPLRPDHGNVVIELLVEEAEDGEWACIRVHDTGPGIHRADFGRVFDYGYSTKEDGFGMGLDICREMAGTVKVGDRRGTVRVIRSILLAGTTFEARLPLRSGEEVGIGKS